MKALLLAAGRGTRISRYLNGNPKCTVDLGHISLIEYTIKMLRRNGIKDIGVVVGYRDEVIRSILANQNVSFFYNPFFDVTNSIGSIWFARDFLNDDMIIMNADVFVEDYLLQKVKDSKYDPVLFSDESRIEDADYRFYYKNNILIKYGKELTNEETTGEYIGIGKISAKFIPVFKKQLDKMIHEQQHDVWWENVLYSLNNQNKIFVEDCKGEFWAEVDYIEDYQRILDYIKQKSNLQG